MLCKSCFVVRATKLCLFVAVVLLSAVPARAGIPDWLRELAARPLPTYPDDPDVVQLLEEHTTTIKKDGEMRIYYRRAYRIVRDGKIDVSLVRVYFDTETQITYLKGYAITSKGVEFEEKEGDAVDTSALSGGVLFSDKKLKILKLRGVEPGAIVGYEYEQRQRPGMYDETWYFQARIPVQEAHMILRLPPDWEYRAYWANHPEEHAKPIGDNAWAWGLSDIPAISREPVMPSEDVVEGRLQLKYFSSRPELKSSQLGSWDDIARWYSSEVTPQIASSPQMKAKVQELTAGQATTLDKIRTLAGFVQSNIRYVAVYIGLGGYVPHPAPDVFANRFGDCKDKATLLASMLKEVGVESYLVLTDTDRGLIDPTIPIFAFNHAILAIRVPNGVSADGLPAAIRTGSSETLLLFDPTSTLTPFSQLPPYLQGNYGLVVTGNGGSLVHLPLGAPAQNLLQRVARFHLSPDGGLTGSVEEIRSGTVAYLERQDLQDLQDEQRDEVIERRLHHFLGSFSLQSLGVANLDAIGENVRAKYELQAPRYAQLSGDLLLVRPRVIGQKSSDFLEKLKERKYPVEYDITRTDTDLFEIELPPGYQADELPQPVHVSTDFAEYKSSTSITDNRLHYERTFTMKQVSFPLAQVPQLREFLRQVAEDEHSWAILKKSGSRE